MKAWPARAAPWLAAALGVAVTLAAFYPGYLSFDSADQWQQARHFAFTSLHPPLQAMLWHFVDRVWPGPGGMFVLQVLLYWSALALLVAQRRWRAPWQALGVLLLGFWPPLFGLLPHLWKDVPMAALLVLAAALASRDLRHPSEWTRAGVLGCLILACTLRHNAMLAVLPFALSAQTTPAAADPTWRDANDAVGQYPRGHADVLKWENNNLPPPTAAPQLPPDRLALRTPAEAIRQAWLAHPDLIAPLQRLRAARLVNDNCFWHRDCVKLRCAGS